MYFETQGSNLMKVKMSRPASLTRKVLSNIHQPIYYNTAFTIAFKGRYCPFSSSIQITVDYEIPYNILSMNNNVK